MIYNSKQYYYQKLANIEKLKEDYLCLDLNLRINIKNTIKIIDGNSNRFKVFLDVIWTYGLQFVQMESYNYFNDKQNQRRIIKSYSLEEQRRLAEYKKQLNN
jgi:hypothetical protein